MILSPIQCNFKSTHLQVSPVRSKRSLASVSPDATRKRVRIETTSSGCHDMDQKSSPADRIGSGVLPKDGKKPMTPVGVRTSRLLWRGRVINNVNKRTLHGIALVAHFFGLPGASPSQSSSQPSPFSNPFTTDVESGASWCLGLEMLRGGDIAALKEVQIVKKGYDAAVGASTGEAVELQGEDVVQVDTPTDVRVYIDPRCLETIEWFNNQFCRKESGDRGWLLNAGGEQVVLFASYPPFEELAKSSAVSQRPTISLHLGRTVKMETRKPRPDDPMPRETLFASKLRRTTSLPTSQRGFKGQTAPTMFEQSKMLTDSDFANAPEAESTGIVMKGITQSKPKLTKVKTQPVTVFPKNNRKLSRSMSMREESLASLRNNRSRPPISRTRWSSAGLAPFHKEEEHEDDDEPLGYPTIVSPTPSIDFSLAGDENEEEGEKRDTVTALQPYHARRTALPAAAAAAATTDFPQGVNRSRSSNFPKNALTRSTSLPVGVLGAAETSGADSAEARNKATLRKMILAKLIEKGIERDHEQFKEIFSMVSKGTQFAMRTTFKVQLMDRNHATNLICRHAEMYTNEATLNILAPEVSATDEAGANLCRAESPINPKQPGYLPSPKSWGNNDGSREE